MELTTEQLEGGIQKINLVGRLDIQGAEKVDLKLTALISTQKTLTVIDISGVEFIASIGVRTLVSNAKASKSRGGKLALAGPNADVMKVLETTGVDTLVPVKATLDEAIEALNSEESAA